MNASGWDEIEGMHSGGYLVDLGEAREKTNPGS